MKRNQLISFILALMIFAGMCLVPVTANATETYDFASFSEADSMNFIENCGIHIPQKLLQSDGLAALTKNIILHVYQDPDIPFGFSYDKTAQYAEDIRAAVKAHMPLPRIRTRTTDTTYSLQYNTVMDATGNWVTSGGYWHQIWENFNCYAYSIHRADENFYGSFLKQYQPGDMCGEGSFTETDTVDELAEVVKNDLLVMGYQDVQLFDTIPSVNSSQELICVRIGSGDYHFMRYDLATNAWYHKPGMTAVLKYNMVPSNNAYWYLEVSRKGTEESLFPFAYDSDIVYIRYAKNQINVSQSNSSQKYIPAGMDRLYEINITDYTNPKIELSSQYSFEYEVYDKKLDVVASGTGRYGMFSSATPGTYYLRVNFESATTSGYVNFETCRYEYWDVADEWHSYSCEYCGEANIEQPHEFVPYRTSTIPQHDHLLRCRCGYLSYGYCVYNIAIPYYTDTHHVMYCLCGAYVTRSHVFAESPVGSDYNWVCVDCGQGDNSLVMPTPQSLVPGDVMMQMNSSGVITLPDGTTLQTLTETGSYVLSNGIIVLSAEDAALVEAGLLDPYELVENITVPSGPDHVTE